MNIAIAGGSGLIGRYLTTFWTREGHRVTHISRSPRPPLPHADVAESWTWEQLREEPDNLGACDAVVHLAGETINQRWTSAAKKRILESRLQTTAAIAQWVKRMPNKPKVVINGSAIGIYGTSLTKTFTESAPSPETGASSDGQTDFLSEVVRQWEHAADQIKDTRVVKLRTGVVLARDGGAFPPMMLPYRLGLGGRIGNGRQWLSWIHIHDLVRIIDHCVHHPDITGPVNATAPTPVSNDEFGRTLGQIMGKPHFMPVPSFVFKLLFGEMSKLLLEGQKALPEKLLQHGFAFEYPTLETALAQLLGRASLK